MEAACVDITVAARWFSQAAFFAKAIRSSHTLQFMPDAVVVVVKFVWLHANRPQLNHANHSLLIDIEQTTQNEQLPM